MKRFISSLLIVFMGLLYGVGVDAISSSPNPEFDRNNIWDKLDELPEVVQSNNSVVNSQAAAVVSAEEVIIEPSLVEPVDSQESEGVSLPADEEVAASKIKLIFRGDKIRASFLELSDEEIFDSVILADVIDSESLMSFVEGLIVSDEGIKEVKIEDGKISVQYDSRSKFLGIFPIGLEQEITAAYSSSDYVGNVKVGYPWWSFLASKKSNNGIDVYVEKINEMVTEYETPVGITDDQEMYYYSAFVTRTIAENMDEYLSESELTKEEAEVADSVDDEESDEGEIVDDNLEE